MLHYITNKLLVNQHTQQLPDDESDIWQIYSAIIYAKN